MSKHITVLLNEAVDSLVHDKGGTFIDGTFGRGGHSRLILDRLNKDGRLIAFDKDEAAIKNAQKLQAEDDRFDVVHDSFASLSQVVKQKDLEGKIDGILLDLGVSSPQLDEGERGFSFMQDGPLDMRMDQRQGLTAEEWIKSVGEKEMAEAFKEYGEERYARRIAKAIVVEREKAAITSTGMLAKIVVEAHPRWEKHKHPATRVFQAIRIVVNEELTDLDTVLDQVPPLLRPGGRLVVISFHSLEDFRVKRFMRRLAKGDDFPAGLPITEDKLNKKFNLIGKAFKPTEEEIKNNPRSRSAVMRVAEKVINI